MPLTPFHLGPALLLGLIFLRYVDFPTFLVANVIVDIEPMFIMLFNLDYSHSARATLVSMTYFIYSVLDFEFYLRREYYTYKSLST